MKGLLQTEVLLCISWNGSLCRQSYVCVCVCVCGEFFLITQHATLHSNITCFT